ncbi:hypothetical protein NM208_g9467 [Fusarium decemcellulare]|uniref:Uncharacterized protein n=1 Tax=Fusarium decemcellulare TaxID=57161 RepID=A0ACC1S1J5_9HYPO|nr:hypothetical protein NM208_g9467 [Fusarium decemcellulare]
MSVFSLCDHNLLRGLALSLALLGAVAIGLPLFTEVDWFQCFLAGLAFLGIACSLHLGPRRRTALKPNVFQEFKLAEKTIVSHNVAIYRFKLPSPDSILGLPIGQHISIGAAIKQPDGGVKEIIRSYTPISGDHQPGYFDLLIKAYPNGNISQLMTSLVISQSIRVRGPKGNFTYTPNMVRRFGMMAGGTGITPMLQIMNAIVRGRPSGDRTEVDLIFANVTAQDILLKDELDKLAQEPGIRVRYVLDKPPPGWQGGVGYITADMITEWLPAPARDVKILLCGPPPMVTSLKKVAESLGYQKARAVSKLEDQVFVF